MAQQKGHSTQGNNGEGKVKDTLRVVNMTQQEYRQEGSGTQTEDARWPWAADEVVWLMDGWFRRDCRERSLGRCPLGPE